MGGESYQPVTGRPTQVRIRAETTENEGTMRSLTVLFLLAVAPFLLVSPGLAQEEVDEVEQMTREEKKEHQKAVKKLLNELKREKNKVVVLSKIERFASEGGIANRDALIAYAKGNKNQQHLDGIFKGLARIGGKVSIEFLCGKGALNSKNFLVQHSAATALGSAGDPRSIEPLMKVMAKSNKSFVVGACANALAKSFPEDEKAVAALFKLSRHKKDMIRSEAYSAIGHLGTDEAVERLKEGLEKDSNSGAKTFAAKGLGNTGRHDVIPILKKVMAESNSLQVKDACHQAIQQILNPR
jgi:hypothetical protein